MRAAEERSLIAARLALAIISIPNDLPSKWLSGLNLQIDRGNPWKSYLGRSDRGQMLGGSSMTLLPEGPLWKDNAWLDFKKSKQNYFDIFGEILNYGLGNALQAKNKNILNLLHQSLVWFHEGCREKSSIISVVKFMASIDAITAGAKEKAIRDILSKATGKDISEPILSNGTTLASVIRKLYGEGRSRAIHGTIDGVGHDWGEYRMIAEYLSARAIEMSAEWASANPSYDDAKNFYKYAKP